MSRRRSSTRTSRWKRVTQWNSDATERLGRLQENSRSTHGVGGRERENAWWFRSWDEVRRQATGDREVLIADVENDEMTAATVVCASFQSCAKNDCTASWLVSASAIDTGTHTRLQQTVE